MTSRSTDPGSRPRSAWVWAFDGQVVGMALDVEEGLLHFYRHVGSLCGDDGGFAERTVEEYLRRGAPPVLGELPEDVEEELREALEAAGWKDHA